MSNNPSTLNRVATVVLWENGAVIALDTMGQLLGEYNGVIVQLAEKILEDAPPDAVFEYIAWSQPPTRMTKQEFTEVVKQVCATTSWQQ